MTALLVSLLALAPASWSILPPAPAPAGNSITPIYGPNEPAQVLPKSEMFDHAAVRDGAVTEIRSFQIGKITDADFRAAYPNIGSVGSGGRLPPTPVLSDAADNAAHEAFAAYLFGSFLDSAIDLASLSEAIGPDHFQQTLQRHVAPICAAPSVRPGLVTLCRDMIATAAGRFRTAWNLRRPGVQNPAVLMTANGIALPNSLVRRSAEAMLAVVSSVRLHRLDTVVRSLANRFSTEPSSYLPEWLASAGWLADQVAAAGRTLPGGMDRPCLGLGTAIRAAHAQERNLRLVNGRVSLSLYQPERGLSAQCLADAATIESAQIAMSDLLNRQRYLTRVVGSEPLWMSISRAALMGTGTEASRFDRAENLVLAALNADALAPTFEVIREQAAKIGGMVASTVAVSQDGNTQLVQTPAYKAVDAVLADGPNSPIVRGFFLTGEPASLALRRALQDLGSETATVQLRLLQVLQEVSSRRQHIATYVLGLSRDLAHDRLVSGPRWRALEIAGGIVMLAAMARGMVGVSRSIAVSLGAAGRGALARLFAYAAAAEMQGLPAVGAYTLEASTVAATASTTAAVATAEAGGAALVRAPGLLGSLSGPARILRVSALRPAGTTLGLMSRPSLVLRIVAAPLVNAGIAAGMTVMAREEAAFQYGLFLIGGGNSQAVTDFNRLHAATLTASAVRSMVMGLVLANGMRGLNMTFLRPLMPARVWSQVSAMLDRSFNLSASNMAAFRRILEAWDFSPVVQRMSRYLGRAMSGAVTPTGRLAVEIAALKQLILMSEGGTDVVISTATIAQLRRLLDANTALGRSLAQAAAADAGSAGAVAMPALAAETVVPNAGALPSSSAAAAGAGLAAPRAAAPLATQPTVSAPLARPAAPAAPIVARGPIPQVPIPSPNSGVSEPSAPGENAPATRPGSGIGAAPSAANRISLQEAIRACMRRSAARPTCIADAVQANSPLTSNLRDAGSLPVRVPATPGAPNVNPIAADVNIAGDRARIIQIADPTTVADATAVADALYGYELGITGPLQRAIHSGAAGAIGQAIAEAVAHYNDLANRIRIACVHVANVDGVGNDGVGDSDDNASHMRRASGQ